MKFFLNGKETEYTGDPSRTLLSVIRNDHHVTSPKDGCSGQGYCGACTVELDGKAVLACVTPMNKVEGKQVLTIEGYPNDLQELLGRAFAVKGAVQCGFCTPGIIVRAKTLIEKNSDPSNEDILKALNFHLCRCTGYKKIIESIRFAAWAWREKQKIEMPKGMGKVGTRMIKYDAVTTALGKRPFVDDIQIKDMLFSALRYSDHPRATVKSIDVSEAEKVKGVVRIFTSKDIPGQKRVGLITRDWPVMVGIGETTRYVGDVLAGVVAETEEIARAARELIKVEYDVLAPVVDMHDALKEGSPQVHPDYKNLLDTCVVKRGGNADEVIKNSDFVVQGVYETQRIEHAFLETEATIARPVGDDAIELFSCTQGAYEDQRQVSEILNISREKVAVVQIQNGGGFGGKEDLSTQGHVALFAWLLKKPVKLHLSRPDSIRMHSKRHPIWMDYTIAANKDGKLTALKAKIVGDTGAYASVGAKVVERAVGHSSGAYVVPCLDVEGYASYTNNPPCGAMRGFGANQAVFAVEVAIDELCEKAGFDRWQFRYDNAIENGSVIATGQELESGVGVKECLLALKDEFYKNKNAGLACGIKNTGVGNGMIDASPVRIKILNSDHIRIEHGWTEMGQGIHTMAIHSLCEETGINPDQVKIEVEVDTRAAIQTGMTTSSRATSLLGNAIIEAAKKLKEDIQSEGLDKLIGRDYEGQWACDFTTKPGSPGKQVTHYSYSYAAQLAIVDDNGKLAKIIAAHDAGKVMNPTLFEGQIEGSLHMGAGYALCEDLPTEGGHIQSYKLKDLQILKAKDTPELEVIGVEAKDPYGPYGAKGVGEIGLVPTAGAIANAFYQQDGVRRRKLPLFRK